MARKAKCGVVADRMIRTVHGVDWVAEPEPLEYSQAVAQMEEWVDAIAARTLRERIWLLEHLPVITAGTSAAPEELLDAARFPVIPAGRGGRYTHHAPGQRIVYAMLDLRTRGRDIRAIVRSLEAWVMASLRLLGVEAFPDSAGTGVWTRRDGTLLKIGAVGLRVRRWVTFHGVSINVTNDLSGFEAIVPCGIRDHGVARLADLAGDVALVDLDRALEVTFPTVFDAGAEDWPLPA
jgi:lipoyl(octanoyl) transferase